MEPIFLQRVVGWCHCWALHHNWIFRTDFFWAIVWIYFVELLSVAQIFSLWMIRQKKCLCRQWAHPMNPCQSLLCTYVETAERNVVLSGRAGLKSIWTLGRAWWIKRRQGPSISGRGLCGKKILFDACLTCVEMI